MAVTAYTDIWNFWNDSTMQTRAMVACMSAANMVLPSAIAGGGTAVKNWARYALNNPQDEGRRAMWGVITNTAIVTNGPTATDAMIFNAVSAYVQVLAATFPTA